MIIKSRKSQNSQKVSIDVPLDTELIMRMSAKYDQDTFVAEYDISSQASDVFLDYVTLIAYITANDIYVSAVGYLNYDDEDDSCSDSEADELLEFSVSMSSEEKIKLLLAIVMAEK